MSATINYSYVIRRIYSKLEENRSYFGVSRLAAEIADTCDIAQRRVEVILRILAAEPSTPVQGRYRGSTLRGLEWSPAQQQSHQVVNDNTLDTHLNSQLADRIQAMAEQINSQMEQLNAAEETYNKLVKDHEELKAKVKDAAGQIEEVHIYKTAKTKKPTVVKERFHRKFKRILALAKARKNIFMFGPTGCGKSFIGGQLARCLDLPFYFISCTSGMSEGQVGGRNLPVANAAEIKAKYTELVKGKMDKQAASVLAAALGSGFSYVISDFVKAYENGGVFLLDEIDACDPNVLLFVNAALANGKCGVPNRPEKPYAERHPDFICIAAANTAGTGADRLYSGRNKLDGATLDRFQVGKLVLDYDTQVEEDLCRATCEEAGVEFNDELLIKCHAIRDAINAARLERAMSTRFILEAYDMFVNHGWTLDEIFDEEDGFFCGWREDEVNKVKQYIS